MPGIKLKHFLKYREKLDDYAKANGLKVYDKETDSEGSYIPSHRKIVIDSTMSDSWEISVFLHELGHAIDFALLNSYPDSQYLDEAYDALYKKTMTAKQRKAVMDCEKKAWELARGLAKVLRIKLGKWFDHVEKECLESYKKQKED